MKTQNIFQILSIWHLMALQHITCRYLFVV